MYSIDYVAPHFASKVGFETRLEARQAAIEKANEIFNNQNK